MHRTMALETYTFNMEYQKGAQNGNTDGLSILAWEEPQPTADDQRHQPSRGEGERGGGGGGFKCQGPTPNIHSR